MYIDEIRTNINGRELLLRSAHEEDAEMLIEFLKITSGETRFLVKEPEEITLTLKDEINFINYRNDSTCDLLLLGFLDGEYVGNCALTGNLTGRYQHRASLGIALYQKYTGIGIGRKMIETILQIAKEKGLEQIELEVVADNKRALSLYQKMGFEIFGTFPNSMKYKDGSYADAYWMMKKL